MAYTFFRSLTLDHLERSIFSLSRQTVMPDDFLFFENSTDYSEDEIKAVVAKHFDITTLRFSFNKHGDPKRTTASWCQNNAIRMAEHDVFILGKADCIYDVTYCERLITEFAYHSTYGNDPMHFVASFLMQMPYFSQKGKPHEDVDHASDLEGLNWRENPKNLLKNTEGAQWHTAALHDAASFCTTKQAMEVANWYDEELIGWSLWQLDLQDAMRRAGVQFHIIEDYLYYHQMHAIEGGERNLKKAHAIYDASSRRKAK